jgi:hypothetical protein
MYEYMFCPIQRAVVSTVATIAALASPYIIYKVIKHLEPIKALVQKNLRDISDLHKFVSDKYEGSPVYKVYKTCQYITTIKVNELRRIFDTPVRKLNKKTYLVSYRLNDKEYLFPVRVKGGPCSIKSVMGIGTGDENTGVESCLRPAGEDITELIRMIYGPGKDYHNGVISPKDLGYDCVLIEYSDGSSTSISSNYPLVNV